MTMPISPLLPAYLSLLLAGLAGSLHCIGMCGPIVVGFSQAAGAGGLTRRAMLQDFLGYHAGRIWTYAILGFLAGLAGMQLRAGSTWAGVQQGVSIGIGTAVIVAGIVLTGVIPGLGTRRLECGVKKLAGARWLGALIRQPGLAPRLLLGAIMGFLPCGLIYAMLVIVAAMPTPAHSAAGMAVFGLGTVPSLTAALGAGRLVQLGGRNLPWLTRLRAHGARLAAVVIILTGAWMIARAAMPHEHCACHDHPAEVSANH
jgi:sulfite exporter TauE/SafE